MTLQSINCWSIKLIKELGRLDTIGHPIVFGTTEEFLRCFGVSSIEELPDIDEVQKQNFKEEAIEEVKTINNRFVRL